MTCPSQSSRRITLGAGEEIFVGKASGMGLARLMTGLVKSKLQGSMEQILQQRLWQG
jgi:hypothetical protein